MVLTLRQPCGWAVVLALSLILMGGPVSACLHADDTPQETDQKILAQISAAQEFQKHGEYAKALQSFGNCYSSLQDLQHQHSGWNKTLVLKQLDTVRSQIKAAQEDADATSGSIPTATSLPTSPSPTRTAYLWKTDVRATIFWIGQHGAKGSVWDAKWTLNNGGEDDPSSRNGYAPQNYAPRLNPFYVALPFDDLTHPDLSRKWVPASWSRKPSDGKPVSWCKDRWVEIRNAEGRACYAQWEDAGPSSTDAAEYVFGSGKTAPANEAGLALSPAVAEYLGISDTATVQWRFVDGQDVKPGEWLKYDELALIYQALHETKGD